MTKTRNRFGQHVLTADKGKSLTNGEIYTLVYISKEDISESDWTEVDISEVPVMDEEATEVDYIAQLQRLGVAL